MPLPTFNNIQGKDGNSREMNTTFSTISFANPESKLSATKFSIGYLNRVMRMSIAKSQAQPGDAYVTYDHKNAVTVYLSMSTAKALYAGIHQMLESNNKIHNVCVDTKNGLLKFSDGIEYGSKTPCISIYYNNPQDQSIIDEIIYQTKSEYHYIYDYNKKNNQYSTGTLFTYELDTILMALDQYWKSGSFAMAASVVEALSYKNAAMMDIMKSIAAKVGAVVPGEDGNTNLRYGRSFLQNNFAMKIDPAQPPVTPALPEPDPNYMVAANQSNTNKFQESSLSDLMDKIINETPPDFGGESEIEVAD